MPSVKTSKYVIGVDPGAPLTLAIISPEGNWIGHAGLTTVADKDGTKWDNNPDKVYRVIKKWVDAAKGPENVDITIEKVNPMPGEGILSSSKFIGSVWMVRGIAASFGITPYFVHPRVWKRVMHLNSDKAKSLAMAKYLFPKRDWRVAKNKDHDFAEAALIAYYRRQAMLGLV